MVQTRRGNKPSMYPGSSQRRVCARNERHDALTSPEVYSMELLDPVEARVLGSLLEKEATTPEYYPLSLNALINACNQRSNREPVMNLDEDEVRLALRGLEDKQLAGRARSADGRV